jgi:acetyltransferase-like isoleucine patch superfamily enzyme
MEEIGCLGAIYKQINVTVESPVRISGSASDSSIGAYSYIQPDTVVFSAHIGRYCSIASGVVIGPGGHPTDWLSTHPFTCDPDDNVLGVSSVFPDYRSLLGAPVSRQNLQAETHIGSDVWLGQNAIIMAGCTVGHGAIVAAGSVVTRDVIPYSIVGGIPAKHIKFRVSENLIDRLLACHWWKYDLSPITAKINYADIEVALNILEEAISFSQIISLSPRRFLIRDALASEIF